MAEYVCEQCGAVNPQSSQFCRSCDAYLGWDAGATTIGGQPVTGTVPETVTAVPTEDAAPSVDPHLAPAGVQLATDPTPHTVEVPDVRTDTTDVTLTPGAPVTARLRVYNASSVVDGFVVEAGAAPAWLDLTHEPLRLMPREEGDLALVLALREGPMVVAQRLSVVLRVSSEADPTAAGEVTLWVTVPPLGPQATLSVEPRLLRLEDQARERFVVRLDNRHANYPQSFTLSGSDPEGVVRFGFVPSVVQVPAGQVVEVRGHFMAPPVRPGQGLSRELTVTAGNDQGQLSTALTVVQYASPEPEDRPVTVRLAPREMRVTNAAGANFEVHVDNRGGHREVELTLAGRDPARAVTVTVHPERLVASPGQVAVARGQVRTTRHVPRGETATYPFTVVATDGVTDLEAPGLLEVTVTPAPIETAELRLMPRHLTLTDDRRGAFEAVVDNTRGTEPLSVGLSAVDSHGTARFSFAPPSLTVPAGHAARSRMTVENPLPPRGEEASRDVEVTASDGEGRVVAAATLTQVATDRRSRTRTLLVLAGAALVLLGLLLPWDLLTRADGLELLEVLLQGGQTSEARIAAAAIRALLSLLVLAMLFGLTGKAGSLTRKSAFLIVLASIGYVVAAVVVQGVTFSLSLGLLAVWVGAVLGYAGGVLARRP